ncbi:unnamed protein product [Microthlaspi erraticum]|uniref:Uncharacterized protein n=1 Tax=Microthlaspi erraticum TaxID=1685480 RepID=A0A6D2K274_9BRAS|nr:unnamed protein product [Microthlaspi erraticum]
MQVEEQVEEAHGGVVEVAPGVVVVAHGGVVGAHGLLSKSMLESMYVSFLAGCFRSIRFGLTEAHGKGQALQFNWLYEKGAFVFHEDSTFSVDFAKPRSSSDVSGAVEDCWPSPCWGGCPAV